MVTTLENWAQPNQKIHFFNQSHKGPFSDDNNYNKYVFQMFSVLSGLSQIPHTASISVFMGELAAAATQDGLGQIRWLSPERQNHVTASGYTVTLH